MKRIAVFASGKGSNAQRLAEYFRQSPDARVVLVVSNKADAPVLDMAKAAGIETLVIDRPSFYDRDDLVQELKKRSIDLIVLAGFLWLVPVSLIRAFPDSIVNVHPSLLPAFGGKGMYGMRVHEAVIAAAAPESGITIHFVNEQFDEGKPIAQFSCPVDKTDTPATLAQKVQQLEHRHFPEVIRSLVEQARTV